MTPARVAAEAGYSRATVYAHWPDRIDLLREVLRALAQGPAAEAALQMLCGMVTHSVLMHGAPPADDVLDSAVDIVVRGLAQHDRD